MKAPTSEQCQQLSEVPARDGGTRAFALFVPQVEGYTAKAIVQLSTKPEQCFELFVWHDGEFPLPDEAPPLELHGCDVAQVSRFAAALVALQSRALEAR